MKSNLLNNLGRKTNKVIFKAKKNAPAILIVTGIVGLAVSSYKIAKASTKAAVILEESKERLEAIHTCKERDNLAEEYTEEDSAKDLMIVYTQTGVKMVKVYAPYVIMGVLSVGCILTSHRILSKRNMALAAAYTTVDQGFKAYRSRVVERFGEDVEYELINNIKKKEIEETVVDEKGKEKTVKKMVNVIDPNSLSPYSKFFDEFNPNWQRNSDFNRMFLNSQQNYANDLLKARGYLFLNEVYDNLGIPRTKAGQVVGWIYNEDNPIGDNYIDFGLYDGSKEVVRDFVNGYEQSILLNFNVDGNIWDLME